MVAISVIRNLILAILLLSIPAFSQTVLTFEWDAHPEAESLAGFKLHQGRVPGSENMVMPVATYTRGSIVTGTLPRPGLGNFCWVLTAYTADGTQSPPSNEVCLIIKPLPPKLKSAILAFLKAPIAGIRAAFVRPKKGLRITDN